MKVIITGGAGYIGSHTLLELLNHGHKVLVIDNLVNGHLDALKVVKSLTNRDFSFAQIDILYEHELIKIFKRFCPDSVIHFAGLKSISDSQNNPLGYYSINVTGTSMLLRAMDASKCRRIIFSSSATVYGNPIYLPIDEDHPVSPVNPYGRTKYFAECLINDWCDSAEGRSAVILRYFNPVGAHISGRLGESPLIIPTNLFPAISEVVFEKQSKLRIFGTDYKTRDGTAERDFVHVVDLARAHLHALANVVDLPQFQIFNVGTGQGATVKEVLDLFKSISGVDFECEICLPREGDADRSVAAVERIERQLGWKSTLKLQEMITSELLWKSCNLDGFESKNVGSLRNSVSFQ